MRMDPKESSLFFLQATLDCSMESWAALKFVLYFANEYVTGFWLTLWVSFLLLIADYEKEPSAVCFTVKCFDCTATWRTTWGTDEMNFLHISYLGSGDKLEPCLVLGYGTEQSATIAIEPEGRPATVDH